MKLFEYRDDQFVDFDQSTPSLTYFFYEDGERVSDADDFCWMMVLVLEYFSRDPCTILRRKYFLELVQEKKDQDIQQKSDEESEQRESDRKTKELERTNFIDEITCNVTQKIRQGRDGILKRVSILESKVEVDKVVKDEVKNLKKLPIVDWDEVAKDLEEVELVKEVEAELMQQILEKRTDIMEIFFKSSEEWVGSLDTDSKPNPLVATNVVDYKREILKRLNKLESIMPNLTCY